MGTRILRYFPNIRFLLFWTPKLGRSYLLLVLGLLSLSIAPALLLPKAFPSLATDSGAAALSSVYAFLFGVLAAVVFVGRLIYVWAANPALADEARALGI